MAQLDECSKAPKRPITIGPASEAFDDSPLEVDWVQTILAASKIKSMPPKEETAPFPRRNWVAPIPLLSPKIRARAPRKMKARSALRNVGMMLGWDLVSWGGTLRLYIKKKFGFALQSKSWPRASRAGPRAYRQAESDLSPAIRPCSARRHLGRQSHFRWAWSVAALDRGPAPRARTARSRSRLKVARSRVVPCAVPQGSSFHSSKLGGVKIARNTRGSGKGLWVAWGMPMGICTVSPAPSSLSSSPTHCLQRPLST